MTIDDDIERRLLNWARWLLGGGPLRGPTISGVYNTGPRPLRADAGIPLIAGEACETDAIVGTMPPIQRDALRAHYARVGPAGQWLGTLSEARVSQVLGCARSTLHARLAAARQKLRAEIGERRRAAARQREAWHAAQQR